MHPEISLNSTAHAHVGILPQEITIAGSNWFSRASHYPIFSLPWYRYRSQALLAVTLLLCTVAGALLSVHRLSPLLGWGDAAWLAGIVIAPLLLACLLGPGLAVLVRRCRLPRHLESAGILCALLAGLATSAALAMAMAQHFQFPSFDKKTGMLSTHKLPKIHTDFKIDWGQSSFEWGPQVDAKYRPGHVPAARKELSPQEQQAALAALFDSVEFKHGEDEGSGKMTLVKSGEYAASGIELPIPEILALMYVCWLGGLFDLFAFVRQRSRIVDVLQREELKRAQGARNAAELRLSVLAAQIEPHFLFNTLASVRSAIASDPQRAAQIVDHMVNFLRSTIPQMRDDASSVTVQLAGQLESARSYLALMKERIARLQFSIDIEPGLDKAQLPPLMLISLVENAVKHGVEPKVGLARIDVLARRVYHGEGGKAQLEVSVSDDGVGFGDSSSGGGIGLSNIQERLRALFGSSASLTLKALPSGGVAAILRLPLSFEA